MIEKGIASVKEQVPTLVYRDGALEVWSMPDGSYQVITPLGCFVAPSVDYARYMVSNGQLLRTSIKKGGR